MNNCPCCSNRAFLKAFGYLPLQNKKRKSHAETIIDKRKKQEAIVYRRELHAKLKLEKEARKMRRK